MRRSHVLQAIGLAVALIASVFFIVTSGIPEYTASELTETKLRFDNAPRPSHKAVISWYVAPDEDRVVMVVRPGHEHDGKAFLKAAGADERHVAFEVSDDIPKLYDDIVGGEAVRIGDGRCSVGFSVEGGFVTAGHCGDVGTEVSGANGQPIGSVDATGFPRQDLASVKASSSWTPKPAVSRYEDGEVTVVGSQEADVDADVCRSGSTTGWKCGRIVAKNQTVNFEETTITGLTKTDVCAEPGDSGGPFITPDGQAQGITSGGSGDCSSGGTTYFQPLNPALSELNLTLLTEGGPAPSPTCGPTTGPTGSPSPSAGHASEESGEFYEVWTPVPEPTSWVPGIEEPPGPPGSIPPAPPSPRPSEPEPTSPGPTGDPSPSPGPTTPCPPGPTSPGPTEPGPPEPGPTDPGPTDPGPTNPGPSSPGPSSPAPTSPRPTSACETGDRLTGTLRTGRWHEKPDGDLQRFSDGEFKGCLDPPDNDNFDLYLMKWEKTKWKVVATGRRSGPYRLITYSGKEGYYVWMIVARSGGGGYTFHMTNP